MVFLWKNLKSPKQWTYFVFLLLFLCHCSSPLFTSTHLESLFSPKSKDCGQVYFLPKGKIRFQLLTKANADWELKVLGIVIEPDLNKGYVLNYSHSGFYHDNYTVTVSNKGLLSSIKTDSSDKSGEVLTNLANMLLQPSQIEAARGQSLAPGTTAPQVVMDMLINPDDKDGLEKLNKFLQKRAYSYRVDIKSPKQESTTCPNEQDNKKGIFYRVNMPYEVQFYSVAGCLDCNICGQNFEEKVCSNALLVHSQTVMLPNASPAFGLNLMRAPLVQKKMEYGFEDGVLTSTILDKPSEVLAGTKIPLNIATAIIELPAKIFKLRVDYATQSNKLSTEEKAALEALIEARAKAESN